MTERISLTGGGHLRGEVAVPGDKSISHRSLLFNGLSHGTATVRGLLDAEDVHSTASCLRALGVQISGDTIHGREGAFIQPNMHLDCGNSGTTMRLMMGLLAGQSLSATLTGDHSLQRRPMRRVAEPLQMMGARFDGSATTAPITIHGGTLRNIQYTSPVASAQVKTALMLAAVQSVGTLEFEEPSMSRDHTERMFRAMGVQFSEHIDSDGVHRLQLTGPQRLQAQSFTVPGDISSAAFFIVAASILPGSDLLIRNVGMNPTRTGVVAALRRMGASIEELSRREVSGEPVADLRIRAAALVGTVIERDEIPRLVDELPILAVAAAHAAGVTVVRDASELRVKESDRIESTANIVRSMGGTIDVYHDGFRVHGCGRNDQYNGFTLSASGDHRVAMAGYVAALSVQGSSVIEGAQSIRTSFPTFQTTMEALRGT